MIKRKSWQDYQKEIADDHYYYARSCIRQNFFPGSEKLFIDMLRNDLGRDLTDDPLHSSCTGIGYHSDIVPLETIMTVVARQFALMTEAGYENLVSSCITSFGVYSEILATWHEFPETEEKARENLYKATGREFRKPASLAHTSDIVFHFREQIAARAKHKLVNAQTGEPLRVVEHIGCHYAKIFPKSGIGGSEFPYVLAGMVESWGGQCVDYPERRHCCGFGFRNYLVQANRGYSIANSHKKLESMAPYKPDFIVANCPGCAMFLDKWQYAIAEMEGTTYGENGHGIPVLTYEEMAGLVLGYDPWVLGMQMHQVDVEPLLDKMGVEYDPAAKYLGRNGKYIGNPRRLWSIAARRTQYTTSENNEASCSHRRRRSGHANGPAPRRTGRRARNHRKGGRIGRQAPGMACAVSVVHPGVGDTHRTAPPHCRARDRGDDPYRSQGVQPRRGSAPGRAYAGMRFGRGLLGLHAFRCLD